MILRPIAGGLEILAPAKLNLFLEILGKRPDGYHELETLMVTIDLYDRLRIIPNDSGMIRLQSNDPTLPTDDSNLVVRAANRLRSTVEPGRAERLGAAIELDKEIPAQAGLGGGSSDAAATLRGLDQLWELNSTPEELTELAGQIGSDVPFFLHGPSALCRGRGEQVEPIALNPESAPFQFVLICPPIGLSTAAVYGGLTPPDSPTDANAALEGFRNGDPDKLGPELFNRLQPVAERIAPELVPIRTSLDSMGSAFTGHLMSGSGSAYFGLARDRDAALDAARRLRQLGTTTVRVVQSGF